MTFKDTLCGLVLSASLALSLGACKDVQNFVDDVRDKSETPAVTETPDYLVDTSSLSSGGRPDFVSPIVIPLSIQSSFTVPVSSDGGDKFTLSESMSLFPYSKSGFLFYQKTNSNGKNHYILISPEVGGNINASNADSLDAILYNSDNTRGNFLSLLTSSPGGHYLVSPGENFHFRVRFPDGNTWPSFDLKAQFDDSRVILQTPTNSWINGVPSTSKHLFISESLFDGNVVHGKYISKEDGYVSDYLDHNGDWIIYKVTEVPAFQGTNNTVDEGLYAYRVSDEQSSFVSIGGASDTLSALMGDVVVIKDPNQGIFSVSLSDSSKKQHAGLEADFVDTSRGKLQSFQINNYLYYLDKSNNFLTMINMDTEEKYAYTSQEFIDPKIYKIENGIFLVEEGERLYSYTSSAFGGSSLDVLTHTPLNPNSSIKTLWSSNSMAYLDYENQSGHHLVSLFLHDYYGPFPIGLPETEITFYNKNPFYLIHNVALEEDGSLVRELNRNQASALEASFVYDLLNDGDYTVKKAFFDDNAFWVQKNSSEAENYYVDVGNQQIYRIDGEYEFKSNPDTTLKESFSIEGVLETSPPTFVLVDENSQFHITVSPK